MAFYLFIYSFIYLFIYYHYYYYYYYFFFFFGGGGGGGDTLTQPLNKAAGLCGSWHWGLFPIPDNLGAVIKQQLNNLALNVSVVWLGSNLERVVTGVLSGKPLLLFRWEPDILTSRPGMTRLSLPTCRWAHPNDSRKEIDRPVYSTGWEMNGIDGEHGHTWERFWKPLSL